MPPGAYASLQGKRRQSYSDPGRIQNLKLSTTPLATYDVAHVSLLCLMITATNG